MRPSDFCRWRRVESSLDAEFTCFAGFDGHGGFLLNGKSCFMMLNNRMSDLMVHLPSLTQTGFVHIIADAMGCQGKNWITSKGQHTLYLSPIHHVHIPTTYPITSMQGMCCWALERSTWTACCMTCEGNQLLR